MDASLAPPPPLEVALSRQDFGYYNWVMAFERPLLPFFVYSFTFLTLISFFGVWPDGRLFAFAVLVPLMGYLLFVWLGSRSLWPRLPESVRVRRYHFEQDAYRVAGEKVAYRELKRVLESRRAVYLVRPDGRADILPKRLLENQATFAAFLRAKVADYRRSSFL